MADRPRKDVGAIVRDGTAIDRAIETARWRVVLRHRQLGLPLVVWRDGRVVEIPGEAGALPEQEAPGSTEGT